MGGACSTNIEEGKYIQSFGWKTRNNVLVGNPEIIIQLLRPKHRWGDNIKMDLQ
jgi:hypothetical protein